jgi:hypothetical protein
VTRAARGATATWRGGRRPSMNAKQSAAKVFTSWRPSTRPWVFPVGASGPRPAPAPVVETARSGPAARAERTRGVNQRSRESAGACAFSLLTEAARGQQCAPSLPAPLLINRQLQAAALHEGR